MELEALESKLHLLDLHRQLSAVHCQNFIRILESSLAECATQSDHDSNDAAGAADDDFRVSAEKPVGLSVPRAFSRSGDAATSWDSLSSSVISSSSSNSSSSSGSWEADLSFYDESCPISRTHSHSHSHSRRSSTGRKQHVRSTASSPRGHAPKSSLRRHSSLNTDAARDFP
ncbi:hypothetical protein CLOM_g11559 [Closterium sp. NIES-68]|nr:hypothetical protein CLOM_g11559 [Closterium sp. NIES-68]GJP64928.1 hypothetical protein CLOP_g21863 [Closterium sp. NIES-67]